MKYFFWLFFCLNIQVATAQIGRQEHHALIALQTFVNDLTTELNTALAQGRQVPANLLANRLKQLAYPPFLAHLQKETTALWQVAQTNTRLFRSAQIALAERIYLAYLKAQEAKMLEDKYHHAEAEMTHALVSMQQSLHLCDSLQSIVIHDITPQNSTLFPAQVGKAHDDFWATWHKAKDAFPTQSYQKRLSFYNQALLQAFQKFIDAASEQGEYLPYPTCLPHCTEKQEEAGAEGR